MCLKVQYEWLQYEPLYLLHIRMAGCMLKLHNNRDIFFVWPINFLCWKHGRLWWCVYGLSYIFYGVAALPKISECRYVNQLPLLVWWIYAAQYENFSMEFLATWGASALMISVSFENDRNCPSSARLLIWSSPHWLCLVWQVIHETLNSWCAIMVLLCLGYL